METFGRVSKYYYAGAQRIAMRVNGILYFLLGDHLGSTSLTTDALGNVTSEQRYTAWGETRSSSGNILTKYTYTGQYSYVSDFGLQYYNARWYDNSLGRFAQTDTMVGNGVQGYDRYAYVSNNPILYNDPSGHFTCSTNKDDDYCPGHTPTGGGSSSGNQPILVKVCGSMGAAVGPEAPGPGCSGSDQATNQMTAWNNETFPGYDIIPSTYPGYQGSNPATDSSVGKSGQAKKIDITVGNQPYVVVAGYSSGVHAGLFYAELRDARGLRTDLILLGPPVESYPGQIIAYDTKGNGMTQENFISRVYALADSNNNNHIMIIDDAGYQRYKDAFNNHKNITYYPYPVADVRDNAGNVVLYGHYMSDDIPYIAQQAYKWLTNGYTYPSP